ncbi:MAG: hypothetical protein WDZ72_10015 [Cyclobacteriaceae bacterium]
MNKKGMTRREFTTGLAISAMGWMMGSSFASKDAEGGQDPSFDLMLEERKYRKLDAYATSDFSKDNLLHQIDFDDRLEIEKLMIGMPMRQIRANLDEFRETNNKFDFGTHTPFWINSQVYLA